MEIENVFEVEAPPDRVYAFLLDVEHIVGCVPGAELVETVDENTFKGRVRIKVGPITVSYAGNAEIADRDAGSHTAVLKASGRETTGSGSARATANMSVNAKDGGSEVKFVTEFSVAGRVANFGRGVMEDVSRRLVGQMANCIKANLEVEDPGTPEPPADSGGSTPAAPAETAPAAPEQESGTSAPPPDQVEAATQVPHPPEPPPAETPAAEDLAAQSQTPETSAAAPPAPPSPAESPHEAAIPPAAPMGGIAAPATTGEAVTGPPGGAAPPPGSDASSTPPAAAPPPRAPVTAEAKPINAVGLFFSILGERIKRLFGRGRS